MEPGADKTDTKNRTELPPLPAVMEISSFNFCSFTTIMLWTEPMGKQLNPPAYHWNRKSPCVLRIEKRVQGYTYVCCTNEIYIYVLCISPFFKHGQMFFIQCFLTVHLYLSDALVVFVSLL